MEMLYISLWGWFHTCILSKFIEIFTLNECSLFHVNNSIKLFLKVSLGAGIDPVSQSMMVVNSGRAIATLMKAEVANFTKLLSKVLCIMAFSPCCLLQSSLQFPMGVGGGLSFKVNKKAKEAFFVI